MIQYSLWKTYNNDDKNTYNSKYTDWQQKSDYVANLRKIYKNGRAMKMAAKEKENKTIEKSVENSEKNAEKAKKKSPEKPVKKKNVHEGHRGRMRDRFLQGGLDTFAPHEVLELLLFEFIPVRNTNPLAHELIDHFGSVKAVLTATYDELVKVPGVGTKTAEGILEVYPFISFKICEWFQGRDELLELYDIAFLGDWFMDTAPDGSMGLIICDTNRRFADFARLNVVPDDLLFTLARQIAEKARGKNYYLLIKEDYNILPFEKAKYLGMMTSRARAYPLDMYILDGYEPVSLFSKEDDEGSGAGE